MSDAEHDDRWTEADQRAKDERDRASAQWQHEEYCRMHGHRGIMNTCDLCGAWKGGSTE